jgi:hypothetical protein
MSSMTRTALEIARGSLFVFVASIVVPVVLFGHVAAVLTGNPAILA